MPSQASKACAPSRGAVSIDHEGRIISARWTVVGRSVVVDSPYGRDREPECNGVEPEEIARALLREIVENAI
jgi:hypothetical protein